MYFIKNLKYLTQFTGIHQARLAKELGVTRQQINNMLRNENFDPRISTVIKISKIFDLSLDQLILFDISKNNL